MIEILLFSILLSNLAVIYLMFKLLPQEKKEEVLREAKINQGVEVMEWQPPKSENERAFEEGVIKAKQ